MTGGRGVTRSLMAGKESEDPGAEKVGGAVVLAGQGATQVGSEGLERAA